MLIIIIEIAKTIDKKKMQKTTKEKQTKTKRKLLHLHSLISLTLNSTLKLKKLYILTGENLT